jgi:PAS domain S-box-containing protein
MKPSSQKKEHVLKDTPLPPNFISQLIANNENNKDELPFQRIIFQNLIEKSPVGIYILEDGEYSYVNTYYANLLGYTKDELTHRVVTLEETIHPDDYPMIKRNIEKRKQGDKKEGRYRLRRINKDGHLIHT